MSINHTGWTYRILDFVAIQESSIMYVQNIHIERCASDIHINICMYEIIEPNPHQICLIYEIMPGSSLIH